jgi:uncharacterized repeat protein (TIGR03803 family)
MTSDGGNGFGTIFKTDGNGNSHQVTETFTPNIQGLEPLGTLQEAPNGKMYAAIYRDALDGEGVIIEYDPSTNAYIKKIDLTAINGRIPNGSLLLASNGKFYGITSFGGVNNWGVIFEYDYISNTYTKKVDLDSANGNCGFGVASLVEVTPGKLYGAGSRGGANDKGVIFEYNFSSNVYTKKIDLTSAGGSVPLNSMLLATNGKLYGMTRDGGATNEGVIFEYDPTTNTYTKKFDFGGVNGKFPGGALVQASNGKLYGTTASGGSLSTGVLFEYDYTINVYTKKMDFATINGWSGRSLMEATNGKLYGVTRFGGTGAGNGTLYEYDYSTNTYTVKFDFDGINGDNPIGTLMQASNGKLYGMTSGGGIGGAIHNEGVIYEYNHITGVYTKKIDLNYGINGSTPLGSLMRASNGKLYGMTRDGGLKGLGTIFEYDHSTGTYTKKIDLDSTIGYHPSGSLIEASNGKLYALADGGTYKKGVIFEYDKTTNTFTKKFDFDGSNGSNPIGSLMEATNGKLYGVTYLGGTNNDGVIFEYDYTTNTYTKKLDLNSGGTGSRPVNSLIQASNGKLYGMTGVGDFGISPGWIYEYDYSTNVYTQKNVFSSANGRDPEGSLIQASNGKIYGMTANGGATGDGVMFEYDYSTNTYVKKFDFGGSNGEHPISSLMQASNGKLYGMTNGGGLYNDGVIFEYDYSTNTYTKKFDFDGSTGSYPTGNLLETGASVGISQPNQKVQFTVFPNPSSHSFTINFSSAMKSKLTLNVINELGATVYTETGNFFSGEYVSTIDLSKQPKGIYFMEIVSDTEKTVKKVVIR